MCVFFCFFFTELESSAVSKGSHYVRFVLQMNKRGVVWSHYLTKATSEILSTCKITILALTICSCSGTQQPEPRVQCVLRGVYFAKSAKVLLKRNRVEGETLSVYEICPQSKRNQIRKGGEHTSTLSLLQVWTAPCAELRLCQEENERHSKVHFRWDVATNRASLAPFIDPKLEAGQCLLCANSVWRCFCVCPQESTWCSVKVQTHLFFLE